MEKPNDALKDLFFDQLHDFSKEPPQGLWESLEVRLNASHTLEDGDEDNKMTTLFRAKLSNLQRNPPKAVWYAIEARLVRSERRQMLWYITAAAAVLLLFFLPLRTYFTDNELATDTKTEAPLASQASTDILSPNKSVRNPLALSKSDPSQLHKNNSAKPSQNKILVVDSETTDAEASVLLIVHEESGQEVNTTAEMVEENDENSKIASDRLTKSILAAKLLGQAMDFELDDSRKKDLTTRQRYNVSLAYGSVPGGSVTANELLYENSNVRYRNDAFQSEMAYETSFYEEIERTDINPPLTLGIKFSYQVGRRFHLETGLTYTSLSVVSKTVEMDDTHNEYQRTLYYLGLPAGIRWDAIKAKQFRGYLAQSVLVEKGIKAVNRSLRYENDKLYEADHYSMNIPGFQLSTLSSLGADISLYNNFSVYGEAGMQIFYLNATQPFNMRSAKMIWPVFQTGIRVNF